MTPRDTELVATLAAERPRLRDWLRRVFPRLHDEAEDILHDAVTETLHRLQHELGIQLAEKLSQHTPCAERVR